MENTKSAKLKERILQLGETPAGLKERILQLAESDEGRSATSRLADFIEEIEEARLKGVKRQAIIDTLKEHGLNFTLNSFKSARRRINNRRAQSLK